jgi:hypothetical protein
MILAAGGEPWPADCYWLLWGWHYPRSTESTRSNSQGWFTNLESEVFPYRQRETDHNTDAKKAKN